LQPSFLQKEEEILPQKSTEEKKYDPTKYINEEFELTEEEQIEYITKFSQYEISGNGIITLNDVINILIDSEVPFDYDELPGIFKKVDGNDDQYINFEEFVSLVKKCK
jgi:Ca2+-binding EF-hand superfamily protein